jgi:hypothetical protein
MRSEISESTARAVESTLMARHGFVVATKGGPFWSAVAATFDMLRALGIGVPAGRDFVERFATTILALVAMPAGLALTPLQRVLLLAHEATHVVQWYGDPAKMPVWYLQHREKRAAYEAGAIAQALAVQWALTGELPASASDLPSALAYGYDLTPEDLALARGLLEQEATAIASGLLPLGPACTAIAAIHALQPDALDPRAVALIRTNSPGVFA